MLSVGEGFVVPITRTEMNQTAKFRSYQNVCQPKKNGKQVARFSKELDFFQVHAKGQYGIAQGATTSLEEVPNLNQSSSKNLKASGVNDVLIAID